MMVAMLSVSFVSCGSDDDDNDNGGISSSSIVGTWKSSHTERYNGYTYTWTEYVTLNSNKTGVTWIEEEDGTKDEEFTFAWTLSGNKLVIAPIGGDWDDDIITSFTIISVSNTTLVIYNGEDNYTYIRVK